MRQITHILVHCTATMAGREVSVEKLNSWHKARNFEPYIDPQTQKVTHAGYHLLIHLDGSVSRIRPDEARGQHCPQCNMNNRAIAVCYVGGIAADGHSPADTRTPAQRMAIRKVIAQLRAKYPGVKVMGHHDVAGVAKACPCFDVNSDL